MSRYCRKRLTEDEVLEARAMVESGVSIRQIARTFDTSFHQAYKHLKGMSARRDLWGGSYEEKEKRVLQLYENGYTPIGICAMVAVNYDTCVHMLAKAGKPFNVESRLSIATTNRMAEMWNAGLTMDEIAQRFSVTIAKVYRALKYRKLI